MSTVATLQAELATLQSHQMRLRTDLATAETALVTARDLMLTDTRPRTSDAAMGAQARVTLLREATSAIDRKLDQTHTDLTQATADATRAALIAQARALGTELAVVEQEWADALTALYAATLAGLQPILQARARWDGLRQQWRDLAQPLGVSTLLLRPGSRQIEYEVSDRLIADLEAQGVDVRALLTEPQINVMGHRDTLPGIPLPGIGRNDTYPSLQKMVGSVIAGLADGALGAANEETEEIAG